MNQEYMLVSKYVLPKHFLLVAEAKRLLRDGVVDNISDACKVVGISRSTFYKYQSSIYHSQKEEYQRKMNISCRLNHKPGVLSKLISSLSTEGINFLTASLTLPVNDVSTFNATCDISNIKCEIDGLKDIVDGLSDIKDFNIISFEN